MKRLTRKQSREIDRIAVARFGFSGTVLMENAGRGAVDTLERIGVVKPVFSEQKTPIVFVCGKGNNGGDGFVMARHLLVRRFRPLVVLLGEPADLSGDAKTNFEILRRCQGDIYAFHDLTSQNRPEFEALLRSGGVLVDALLGTGATGAPRHPFAEAIETINRIKREIRRPVVALDIPSGLDADSGIPGSPTILADVTLTFYSAKTGFDSLEAAPFLGTVYVQDIGLPGNLIADT